MQFIITQLIVKPIGHCLSNSVKDETNVCTLDQTIVSPPSHGYQSPPSNAQIDALIAGPTSVETLLTQANHINTLPVSRVLRSDVLLAPKDYNSTRNGTPVSSTESTRPNHNIKYFAFLNSESKTKNSLSYSLSFLFYLSFWKHFICYMDISF